MSLEFLRKEPTTLTLRFGCHVARAALEARVVDSSVFITRMILLKCVSEMLFSD